MRKILSTLKNISLFFLFAFLIYSSYCVYFLFIERNYVEQQYLSFDLDGDGIFGGEEITEEKRYWESRVIHDTGLMFVPFFAIPPAIIGSLLLRVLLKVIKRFREVSTKEHNALKDISLFFLFAFLIYSGIIGFHLLRDNYYEQQYLSFDLDGDGIIAGEEITEEQRFWNFRHIDDTALAMSPYFSIPFSIIGSLLLLAIVKVIKHFREVSTKKHNALKDIFLFFLFAFLIYSGIIGFHLLKDNYYEQQYWSSDLDSDGIFAGEEITKEQKFWELRHIDDTALAMSPYFSIPSSIISSLLLLVLVKVIKHFREVSTKKHNSLKDIFLFFLFAFLIYSGIIGFHLLRDNYYEQQYWSYDLDGDGIFAGEEITEEQKFWELRHIDDTALAMSPYFSIPSSIIGSLLLLAIVRVIKHSRVKHVKKSQYRT